MTPKPNLKITVETTGWELNPRQTDNCEHLNLITEGCMWCCVDCDRDMHRCGGCGERLKHGQFTCTACYKLYFTDPPE